MPTRYNTMTMLTRCMIRYAAMVQWVRTPWAMLWTATLSQVHCCLLTAFRHTWQLPIANQSMPIASQQATIYLQASVRFLPIDRMAFCVQTDTNLAQRRRMG